jgi:spore germination protein YaaH
MDDHLRRAQAPDIAGRAFTITATFDAKAPQGVIVAQGGTSRGYTLFLQDGKLTFLVRTADQTTSVATREPVTGAHTAVATFDKSGALSLTLDSQPALSAKAPGLIEVTPVDGLDVGSDTGGTVGPYSGENKFQGPIDSVKIELN